MTSYGGESRWAKLWATRGRRIGLSALFMLAIALIILVVWVKKFDDNPVDSLDNLFILLSSTVIALVGVSITGYIFLTESLRSIRESNPRYYTAANEYQQMIFKRLMQTFAIGIVLVVLYALVAYYLDSLMGLQTDVGLRTLVMALSVLSFIVFLCISIHYDLQMMSIDSGIDSKAREILDKKRGELESRPLVVRLNPEEFKELTRPDAAGRREFVPVHLHDGIDYPGLIYGIKGKDSARIDWTNKTPEEHLKVAYRDMVDEFESNRVISVFDDIERILCRMAGTNSETLGETDRKRLDSILGVGNGRMSESGIANDIIDYYYEL